MTTTDSLIANYANPIANGVDLTASDYDHTAERLASLLRDAANQLSPMDQTRDWLDEAAADLDAIARLGDGGAKTQKLLDRIDATLYEAKSELEMN
jgi:hypothetical protein